MRRRWLWLGLLITGCTGGAVVYDLSAVKNPTLAVQADGTQVLSYSLLAETVYYSPGLRRQSRGDETYFEVVRCKVGSSCTVDLAGKVCGTLTCVSFPGDQTVKIVLGDAKGNRLPVVSGR